MESISRSGDSSQPRTETARAPRGEELQQASSRFAELLTKERRETRGQKPTAERAADDANDGDEAAAGADSRFDSTSPYACGIFLPGERGQQPHRQQPQREPTTDALNEEIGFDKPRFLGPPPTTGDEAPTFDEPRFLGPAMTIGGDERARQESNPQPDAEAAARFEAELGVENGAHSLPTPGDLMLQALTRPTVAGAQETAEASPTRSVEQIDAILQLGEQIAERILVSRTEAGAQEMWIQLKDSALPGTEVRMMRDGERLQVTLVTDHASSFDLLAARQADLQAKLGDNVVVQLTFDPEGAISRQRMERPLAAEAGSQTGDDRGRDRDPDGRSRGRQPRQDRERDS